MNNEHAKILENAAKAILKDISKTIDLDINWRKQFVKHESSAMSTIVDTQNLMDFKDAVELNFGSWK
jgi:hypothetical protein